MEDNTPFDTVGSVQTDGEDAPMALVREAELESVYYRTTVQRAFLR